MDKITVPHFLEMKRKGEKIAALTAYDYLFASLLDKAGIDLILVGDSAAMVFQGEETTIPFTMDQAVYHSRVVRRGVSRAVLVADMPFLSYHSSVDQAVENAGRFFKDALVDAVKMEGGRSMVPAVEKIIAAGMPVVGHLGLTPQHIKRFGGYRVQATTSDEADKLLDDALALQEAGIFALVLEKIPADLAQKVSTALDIPTIGIGAGPHCDGQILVTHDLLGLFQAFQPKFARKYANLADDIINSCSQYRNDVKDNTFPNADESY